MKKLIIILIFAIFSCNDNTPHVKETTIHLHSRSGWSASTSSFECDSVKMLSKSVDNQDTTRKRKLYLLS